ncbi:MAG: Gfo/Idh/MocA family oxidoreductase [Verrucomicrobiae bacterium]|nr:Gfo/Idh/MocA family oxidoreductase [Verrucomicrobiae bacterium]
MRLGTRLFSYLFYGFFLFFLTALPARDSIRIGIAGMRHGHVNGFLNRGALTSLEIVGIYETDPAVIKKYRERYDLKPDLFVSDLEAFLDKEKPVAIWAFTSTFDHLSVVQACAPRGIHVVVEKPLAVDLASAREMARLARKYGTHVLTNLETSWFPSLHEAYRLAVAEKQLGPITKLVSHFGHKGPIENGAPSEFTAWLTDPVLDGGGASADFGCYGGNLTTWIMGNRRPLSVTAVFQTNKPDVYPKVDDNATLILEYPGAQSIIQASWDWPFPRKDMHIYGRRGIIRTIDTQRYDIRMDRKEDPVEKTAPASPEPHGSSFDFFTAVLKGEVDPKDSLSSLENNLIAVEIQEAARLSAETGKTIKLPLP